MPTTKTDRSNVYVLDSFGMLAYLQKEVAAREMRHLFDRARRGELELLMSVINYGEVLYIVERALGLEQVHRVISALDQLPLTMREVDRNLVQAAAHVKATCAISYADAFAVALARSTNGTVVTGDPEFKKVEGDVPVLWLSK
jgi:ribonuclease VapC